MKKLAQNLMENLAQKMRNSRSSRSSFQFFPALAAAILLSLFAPAVHADGLIVSLSSLSNVAAGSTGNSFDVLLTNSGGSDVSIDGFFFGVSSSSADVTFTDANTSSTTATYIFDGDSLFGPDIIGPGSTATDISGSDIGLSSFDLTPGTTVALGHVLFHISPSAPTQTVTFNLDAFPGTSLSDEAGADIPIATLNGGQFEIIGNSAPVPQPATLLLLVPFLPVVLAHRRLSR